MKKIGLLVMALILALGALGVGYAKWTDTVTMNATVGTGDLCVRWVNVSSTDPCSPATLDQHVNLVGSNLNPIPFTYAELCTVGGLGIADGDKNVGCTTVAIDPNDPRIFTAILNNTYPSYLVSIAGHEYNCGTIPWKRTAITISWIDGNGQPQSLIVPDHTCVQLTGLDRNGHNSPVLEVLWGNGTGEQIHPGDLHESSFYVHVMQEAAQGATYTLKFTAQVVQWNEYP